MLVLSTLHGFFCGKPEVDLTKHPHFLQWKRSSFNFASWRSVKYQSSREWRWSHKALWRLI